MADRPLAFAGSPDANPEIKPYWDGCEAGKLMLTRCKDSGRAFTYPRGISPFTLGPVEWVEASGRGTIYSVSVMQRAEVPYAIAYVTLEEGPTMLTNIVDCDLAALKIGQPVKVVFKPTSDGPPVPMFTPA